MINYSAFYVPGTRGHVHEFNISGACPCGLLGPAKCCASNPRCICRRCYLVRHGREAELETKPLKKEEAW